LSTPHLEPLPSRQESDGHAAGPPPAVYFADLLLSTKELVTQTFYYPTNVNNVKTQIY